MGASVLPLDYGPLVLLVEGCEVLLQLLILSLAS
jgi:hypothetical protein